VKIVSRLPLMTSLLILAAACGKAGKPTGLPYREELRADGSNISGTYTAELFPVNINLHAPKAGKATFTRMGDELTARVKLEVGAKGAYYRQAVYWGSRCPGIESDQNKDGYLDMTEIEAALGDVIIPLDGDLDSQSGGTGNYPSGMNPRGSFFYKKTASFSRFFEDLKDQDPNTHDRVRKLEDQQGFTFLGKVILIQGATEDFKIPTTVSSYYGLSRERSLPIACGVFFRSGSPLSDEAETVIVTSGEPDDRPDEPTPEVDPIPTPDPTPTPRPEPEVNPIPRPDPAPTPRPQPRPTPNDGDDDDDEDDGTVVDDVVDDVRDWWDRVTGNDDDDND
jgi:hypothetical protein